MLAALRRGPGLLAAAGRRCSGARLPARWDKAPGRRGAAWGAGSLRGPSSGGVLAALAAFSLFSKNAEEETKEGDSAGTEDTIIFLLKKAKLSIMKGELEEAERILHEAVRLSHQSDNKKAIIYTYDLMANLAFLRGQLDSAEKLFKAAMSFLLAGDMKQDDNAIIEMSLKLASIYAAQNQHKLALAGYEFCILTLDEKIAKYKDLPEDVLPGRKLLDSCCHQCSFLPLTAPSSHSLTGFFSHELQSSSVSFPSLPHLTSLCFLHHPVTCALPPPLSNLLLHSPCVCSGSNTSHWLPAHGALNLSYCPAVLPFVTAIPAASASPSAFAIK
nr:tetratricopeptide repeat protein 19, mitochondrial isoform X5 [Chrysemys picta bellii]